MREFIGIVFLILISSVCANAQKTVILGKITEAGSNNPVPYVNIIFKDTFTGTTSDLNGNYNLSSLTPTPVIEVSAVGYKKQTFKIKLKQEIGRAHV